MNIFMFTNNYLPHVGGVTRSVVLWTTELRKCGHRVIVVTPRTTGEPRNEVDVLRSPAIPRTHQQDYSLPLPSLGWLQRQVRGLRPDIIHAHHPFLLGHSALRLASEWQVPLVFTHHTQYHLYTHYAGSDSAMFQQFVAQAVAGYCNLCDAVIAPSQSIAAQLEQSGVVSRIEVVPTAVDLNAFSGGNPVDFRQRLGIPSNAFLVGHVGRLTEEKNLEFLVPTFLAFLSAQANAWLLIAGEGPLKQSMQRAISASPVAGRVVFLGNLPTHELRDAYASFDVFAFASQTETQGLVVAEAMAAGTPVVAIDAPGVREVVRDGHNGRLVHQVDVPKFVAALRDMASLVPGDLQTHRQAATATAQAISIESCRSRLLALYESLVTTHKENELAEPQLALRLRRRAAAEWTIWRNYGRALARTVRANP